MEGVNLFLTSSILIPYTRTVREFFNSLPVASGLVWGEMNVHEYTCYSAARYLTNGIIQQATGKESQTILVRTGQYCLN